MERSISRQLVNQLTIWAGSDWNARLAPGTMLYQWKGKQIVPHVRTNETMEYRVIRPYGRYVLVRSRSRQLLVLMSAVELILTRPLTKVRLTSGLNRILVHDYMRKKAPGVAYIYERLTDDQAVTFADQALNGDWYIPTAPHRIRVDDIESFDWDEDVPVVDSKSFHFQLHYWTTVNQLTRAYRTTGRLDYLAYAERVIRSWTRKHSTFRAPLDRVAYDPHGTAVRVFHLLSFWDAYRQSELHRDPRLTELILGVVYDHAVLLASSAFYRVRHNQGLFQDMALLAVSEMFPEFEGSEDWGRIARARLDDQLEASLADDGTHLEHSPGYHVYVYHTLARFKEWAELNGIELPQRLGTIRQMPMQLAYMVKPNRTLPIFGDTSGHIRPYDLIPDTQDFPELVYALSGGKDGVIPTELYKQLGTQYAVMREYWTHPKRAFSDATHIMMTAGYNGYAHKHADDLSLDLYGLGRDFIVETGRYGYTDRVERAQALRVAAHNTVHRLGEELDLSVEHIGQSGIVSVQQDVKAIVAHGVSRLIGNGATHERRLIYDKARTLLVDDRITSPEPDMFVQRFHLGVGLHLVGGSVQERDVLFRDLNRRSIQFVQLIQTDGSYMDIEASHVASRDFEWVERRQVVSVEYGTNVRYLTLIRLDRTDNPIVKTTFEQQRGLDVVTYWLASGTKHSIRIPVSEN
ncbi:heparinase II/III family protein [Exiguobacterium sp. TNDT2]|uniref:heparinase II/III family protein n=1 Tax=Exiguobacterium sp. TNDT2 TaxID=2233531 RepID=UPI001E605FF6|nr:heparinase II/III family protein [Exiguobacterium sp. TNDT2]